MYKFGWKKDNPDERDFKYSSLKRQEFAGPLPDKVDLRKYMPTVYDQGNLGSCTANAIAGALAYLRYKDNNLADWSPSRLFIYYYERVLEDSIKEDSGAQIRTGIRVVGEQGAPPEEFWPYNIDLWTCDPPSNVDMEGYKYRALNYYRVDWTDLNEVRSCLAAGFPIVFGFMVYPNFNSDMCAKTGYLQMPNKKRERPDGGHAVLLCGYDESKELFLVRNSWGERWGQRGYFWMPYEYVTDTELSDDFWTIRATM